MKSRILSLCLVAALGTAASAFAQNLLSNPDFDSGSGLDSWSSITGSWDLGGDSGTCALSSSAAGASALSGTDQYLALRSEQCVPVDPAATPTLYLGVRFATAANVWPRLYLEYFSDGACAVFGGWSPTVFAAAAPTWTALLGPVAIPESVGSVQVWADFNPAVAGLPAYTGSFDRFYLGAVPLLFADDFEVESGSACRWSSRVGGI